MADKIEYSKPVPPFVRFCAANVPMVFDDSLSYYEALCALWKWLQTDVIDVINNNAAVTQKWREELTEFETDITDKFNLLKDFVDNYFDNLDVQEEINNKLDQMAEDGTLTDIIAQYLTLAGVLAFSTVSELTAAENLADGSKAKTFGYLREGDGVYNLYQIRERGISDIPDGYNIIVLTNTPTLVAERLQYGKELVIELKTTDNIQSYLNIVGKKTIIMPKDTTITVEDALHVNSDTEINLNGSTIVFDYERPASFPAVDWDETLGFVSFVASDTFTGYNGHKNITIRNGKIKGGCSCFLHSVNVLFEDVEFSDLLSRHAMQYAGCYNVTVRKCIFNGTLHQAGDEESAECINIDPCTYGGQPWLDENSVMYDDTSNKFFTIDANKFKEASSDGQLYACGAGSHGGANSTLVICDNITFTNNDFGEPYKDAINLRDYIHAVVNNNTVIFGASHATYTSFVHIRGGVNDVIISNNLAKNMVQFCYTDSNTRDRKNIKIDSNTIEASDLSGYAVIQLFHFEDVYVTNNTIKCNYRAIHTDALYSSGNLITDTESRNVNFKMNEVYTSGGGDVFLRFKNTIGVNIISNVIEYVGVNNMAWEYCVAIQEGTTNVIAMHNKTSDPRHFVNITSVTDKFMYNQAIYQLSNLSGTNLSGTLASALTNFTKLVLPLGDTAHTQFVELQPWTPTNRNKFYWGSDTVRIYKFPVAKSDNTIGIGVLTINSDNTFTYSGDVSLRSIYARD